MNLRCFTKTYLNTFLCSVCGSRSFVICEVIICGGSNYRAYCKSCGNRGKKVHKKTSLLFVPSLSDIPEKKIKIKSHIKCVMSERLLNNYKKSGYSIINGIPSHLLVNESFYGKSKKGYQVHHLNGIKHDNKPDNLICIPKNIHKTIHQIISLRRQTLSRQEVINIVKDITGEDIK